DALNTEILGFRNSIYTTNEIVRKKKLHLRTLDRKLVVVFCLIIGVPAAVGENRNDEGLIRGRFELNKAEHIEFKYDSETSTSLILIIAAPG
ncbi:MAG TPA: hypothetical protein VLR10_04840, partial [Nitrososphaeraceae archaeon]|nr:hypothetical protein [Nitrososphaeraceae archaeon]